jgi:hypothetical protein
MKCTAKNRRGQRCRAFALRGQAKCALHSEPDAGAKLARQRRRQFDPILLTPLSQPKTAEELVNWIGTTLVELRQGLIDPRVAGITSALVTAFLRAFEVANVETRLTRLEEQYAERSVGGRRILQ